MKKILIINPPSNNNIWQILFENVKNNLSSTHDVLFDEKLFWDKHADIKLIHINFIETLISKQKKIEELKQVLNFYKENNTKIIVTRHDVGNLRNQQQKFKKYYSLIYSYADAIIHLGQWSVEEYKNNYHFKNENLIIEHPLYFGIKNTTTKSEARKILKIPNDAKVILVFGNIRNIDEMKLILKTFFYVKNKQKYLLTTRAYFGKYKLVYKICMFFFSFFKNISINDKNIPEEHLQYYFKGANILLLPRIKQENLNSGVLFLSLFFKLPVIGPNHANIGEVLKNTNQILFNINPIDCQSIAAKIDDFFKHENTIKQSIDTHTKNYEFNVILKKYIDTFMAYTN